MKKQSGFTLIELLLVLAIIGIIAAIAIPALLGQREKAKIRATEALMNNITGEIARAGDDRRAIEGSAFTGSTVIPKVLTLSNYKYPKAKNPYGGTSDPYIQAAAGGIGRVGLFFSAAYPDPVTGSPHPTVIARAKYKKGSAVVSISKFIAID